MSPQVNFWTWSRLQTQSPLYEGNMESPRDELCTLSEMYTVHLSLSITKKELWVFKNFLFYTGI